MPRSAAQPPARSSRAWLLALGCALAGCQESQPRESTKTPQTAPTTQETPASTSRDTTVEAATDPSSPVGYLKGSTHVHTNGSGDCTTPVVDVVSWYREHDYDFIVLTDHDRITGYRARAPDRDDLLVLPGVELTNNPKRCWPPPRRGEGCRIHVNALFLTGHRQQANVDSSMGPNRGRVRWNKQGHVWRIDMYQQALDESAALGGLTQINHPTWYAGVDGRLLAELGTRGAHFVEIANQAFTDWNRGDTTRPSTEAIWDHALGRGIRLFGVASDDAHHYRERPQNGPYYPPGTGFVMVRAERDAASIRAAMARGDFYSSTGVLLADIAVDDEAVSISVASPGAHDIAFIGTRDGRPGQTLARQRGRRALIARPASGYVRAVISDDRGARAWTQPVFASTQ